MTKIELPISSVPSGKTSEPTHAQIKTRKKPPAHTSHPAPGPCTSNLFINSVTNNYIKYTPTFRPRSHVTTFGLRRSSAAARNGGDVSRWSDAARRRTSFFMSGGERAKRAERRRRLDAKSGASRRLRRARSAWVAAARSARGESFLLVLQRNLL